MDREDCGGREMKEEIGKGNGGREERRGMKGH